MAHYIRAIQTYGLKGTARRLYQFKDIKFGTLKGTDEFGNKYYEDLSLPLGQHRWIEPAHFDAPGLFDASRIPPTWHGWMHSTTDIVPASAKEVPARTGEAIAQTTHNDVNHHYNVEHRREWRPNPTLHRERGYGVDHHYGKAGENNFYVQPGHVQSPIHTETGPKIEAWGAQPTARGTEVPVKREAWEEFYEQRKKMNAEARK